MVLLLLGNLYFFLKASLSSQENKINSKITHHFDIVDAVIGVHSATAIMFLTFLQQWLNSHWAASDLHHDVGDGSWNNK